MPVDTGPTSALDITDTPLAQSAIEICGDDAVAGWFCRLIYDSTGNEVLARAAGVVGTFGRVVAILVVAYLVTRLLRMWISGFARRMERTIEQRLDQAQQRGAISSTHRYRTRRLQRLQAIVGVMRGIVAAAVWIIAVLVVLNELDIRLQPILAGAGLLGVIVGFGAQQLVRDVLAGIAMLIEDQYGVGDWIEVDGRFGEVERVGLRSTAFRDLDGVVHHVLNGYLQHVGNLSQKWARSTFDVPLALETDIPAAKALIYKVATDLAEDPVWGPDIIGPPEVWGVQEFGPEGIKIRLVMPTKPLRNWDITRQLRERMKLAFDHADIKMPSRLIALGGQEPGHPVRTETVVHRPPDAPDPMPDSAWVDEAAAAATTDLTDRDVTDRLRMEGGPRPRPD
ncbi:MAG: mechanosensitive ion channel family protein [Nitriliruptoraceae bacterium]